MNIGETMHEWARTLFPICRSLSGNGVRSTLAFIQGLLPGLEIHSVASGVKAFDWTVPDEWNIRDAYIAGMDGRKWVDFGASNLHVVGYSEPVNLRLSRQELEPHLYSLPEQPDAIPYATSFYERTWGFCLTHRQRLALPQGPFHVVIDADLGPGVLNYADLLIPGDSEEEILLSTYVCHPSMANNELSGPVVACALGRWLQALPHRRYSYRLVFVPETIGSIVYISRHLQHLRSRVRAGYVLTCLGDERAYSFIPSRRDGTLADRVGRAVLQELAPDYREYAFLDRGSDERQYCSPGVDLPIASLMRSKYGCYPEYHTSLDDLDLVTPRGLAGGYEALHRCITVLESNETYRASQLCEPQLGKRGLYPNLSSRGHRTDAVRNIMNILAYADGTLDCVGLSAVTKVPVSECLAICARLAENGVLTRVDAAVS